MADKLSFEDWLKRFYGLDYQHLMAKRIIPKHMVEAWKNRYQEYLKQK